MIIEEKDPIRLGIPGISNIKFIRGSISYKIIILFLKLVIISFSHYLYMVHFIVMELKIKKPNLTNFILKKPFEFNYILSLIILLFVIPNNFYVIFNWFDLCNFNFRFDKTSKMFAIMLILISLAVNTFNGIYLKKHPFFKRFYFMLNMFTMSMFLLIFTDEPILYFSFWEYIGISSFGSILFYDTSLLALLNSIKSFIYNKIGDAFLMVAAIYLTKNYDTQLVIYFFSLAIIAKSAMLGLGCYLPDSMAGPTTVSSLLHSSTLVVAGTHLIFKFDIHAQYLIYYGLITSIIGGLLSLTQYDLKKIVAYSTISQIGLIMAFQENSVAFVISHSFYKSAIFMLIGVIIYETRKQDIRNF